MFTQTIETYSILHVTILYSGLNKPIHIHHDSSIDLVSTLLPFPRSDWQMWSIQLNVEKQYVSHPLLSAFVLHL